MGGICIRVFFIGKANKFEVKALQNILSITKLKISSFTRK